MWKDEPCDGIWQQKGMLGRDDHIKTGGGYDDEHGVGFLFGIASDGKGQH